MAESPSQRRFATLAVHSGASHDPTTGAVIEPISLSTTYVHTSPTQPVGEYIYSRSSNPNRDSLERSIAALDNARYALAFSSGSAATAAILQTLPPGSHVISVSDLYGGTHRYFTKIATATGIKTTFTPKIEEDFDSLVTSETKLIWIETPSNPTLVLVDIQAVAEKAHRRGITVVVDNTFLSPYIQTPLDHGADVVIHSVTKWINGHSDVVLGAVVFNSDALHEPLKFLQNAIGAVPSAFDCWLALRGIKTLHLRMEAASRNADRLAHMLEASPYVRAVNYPGLASHKQRSIAIKQHRDGMGGGMLSFRVKGGTNAAEILCKSTRIFTLAESLGGVESLVEIPSSMSHAAVSRKEREDAGLYDDLVRVSVGVEHVDDLMADMQQALEKVAAASDEEKRAGKFSSKL